jgi:alpha-glucosidase
MPHALQLPPHSQQKWQAGRSPACGRVRGLAAPGAWPNWVLGNHDQHRIATRIGPAQARIANMLLLTLRGTPTTYYGEEIGMENGHIPPEFVQDPPPSTSRRLPTSSAATRSARRCSGTIHPMPVLPPPRRSPGCPSPPITHLNVARQEADPTSMLNLYRALTHLRQSEPALSVGDYETVDTAVSDIFAYQRTSPNADDAFSFCSILAAAPHWWT